MPVTRPGMHTNEVSMNAPIKTGEANQQVSRRLSAITYLRRIWLRVFSPRVSRREVHPGKSNECHKVARRWRATAVKLCEMTDKERERERDDGVVVVRNVGELDWDHYTKRRKSAKSEWKQILRSFIDTSDLSFNPKFDRIYNTIWL